MKASIHISTNHIEVLAYTKSGDRVNVKDYLSSPLPEECVLNGIILDSAPIVEGMLSLKSSKPQYFKDVSLVIDGSFVYTKQITVPGKLSKIMYDEVIRDEFSEITAESENLICDYYHLKNNEDGSKQVLACAVEIGHAQAYLELFKAAGITPKSVNLGIHTVLHYIKRRQDLKDIPMILNVVDDELLISLIFHGGINVFQSRTKLYGEDRTALIRSTLGGISGIIQFNKSQNFTDLTNCYYLGLDDNEMKLVAAENSYPELTFYPLDIYKDAKNANRLPPGAHFIYLNTMIPSSQADLLSNIKMLEKAKQRRRPKKRWIPILVLVVLLLAGAIGGLYYLVYGVDQDINTLNAFLRNPAIIEERNEIEALVANTAYIDSLFNDVATLKDDIAARPHVTRQLLDTVIRTGGHTVEVTGISFNSANGTLSVSCSGDTEYNAAAFVEALNRHALIDTVDYTGFRVGSAGEFAFSITVIAEGWREEAESD
ncbi:MAG: pilus assembly protein PilM [Oscillospiraceae bacterium]|jgi:hypothetical protein|nr:pilus assembly protein PilM [Oscillospiraceae bacterium]